MTAKATVEVRLRPMRWQDIPALARLEPVLFGLDAWTEPTWWAELAARPRRSYAVAERAGERAGEICGEICGYVGVDRAGEVADVMTVAVAPAAQGTGLGRRLLAWAVGEAKASGAAYLMLEVRADNLAARALYERGGFQLLSIRRRYYQPGDVDAQIMRLDLRAVEQ